MALVTMSIIAGANALSKVEVVVEDRRISRKYKGNVLNSCVTPAYMYDLDHDTLSETTREGARLRPLLGKKNPGR